MNFITFYALATNFLAFWGFAVYMTLEAVRDGAPGGMYIALLIVFLIAAFVISLMPFIVPLIVTALIGLAIHPGENGHWLLQFFSMGLLLGSAGILFLFGQINIDSLRARYWRHMWTHKSPLERKLGASSPYTEAEMDSNWRTLFFPIIAPFLLLSMVGQTETNTEARE